MNQTQQNSSKATEVWKRMSGLFGGDALERKFGAQPPVEWHALLGKLKDYEVDRGLRRLAYSGKAHVPSLPEFVKLCRMVGGDEVDEGPKLIALPPQDGFTGDKWDMGGNLHLLGHITRAMKVDPRCYGPIKPFTFRWLKDEQRMENPASEQQAVSTRILLRYKHAWATDMREWGVDEITGEVIEPSPEQQKTAWDDCMRMAEAEIAHLSARAAA